MFFMPHRSTLKYMLSPFFGGQNQVHSLWFSQFFLMHNLEYLWEGYVHR